jgi:hypothetical protein
MGSVLSRHIMKTCSLRLRSGIIGRLTILLLLITSPSHALIFEIGELNAQLDTTLSIGGAYRTSSPNPDFYGLPNGGNQFSINLHLGNLAYDSEGRFRPTAYIAPHHPKSLDTPNPK